MENDKEITKSVRIVQETKKVLFWNKYKYNLCIDVSDGDNTLSWNVTLSEIPHFDQVKELINIYTESFKELYG